MASLVEASWAHSTVLIETEFGTRGTGFLVGRPIGNDQWHVFLVTNKHVLHDDPGKRASLRKVKLHINVLRNGVLAGEVVDYPLSDPSGNWYREHPSPDVDVLAIFACPLFSNVSGLANKFVPEALFAVKSKREELDITAGEEIIVVGYPSGIRQGRTNFPMLRQGMIASRIGEELHEEVDLPGGSKKIRISRGFLIDGGAIPGSSGSPVILKPVSGRHCQGTLVIGSNPPVLLGILAQTRFAGIPFQGISIPSFAGLGLAFDVETVVEVMNLF